MKKELQKEWEMQDDELYALLDSAMEDDRLCVSEDLIQRTLQRVKEEDRTATVTLRKSRYRAWISYAGMAAAALLVVFVGTKTINNRSKESADMVAPRSEVAKTMDDGTNYSPSAEWEGSTNGMASTNAVDGSDMLEDDADAIRGQKDTPTTPREWIEADPVPDTTGAYLRGGELVFSQKMQTLLQQEGYGSFDGFAECWNYAGEKDDVEALLEKALLDGKVTDGLANTGTYCYPVVDREGNERTILSDVPVDKVIRIRTEREVLWFLVGEETLIFIE